MAETVQDLKPIGNYGRGVMVGSLIIAALSWGHFFLNQFVDTGVASNVPIGAFAVALVASMVLFKRLQAPLRGKRTVLWALTGFNFLAMSALQLLAVHFFA